MKELIADPKRTREIHDAIATGRDPYGMVSFDQCLTELVQKKLVTYAEAASNATNAADFALHFRGVSKGGSVDMPPAQATGVNIPRPGPAGGTRPVSPRLPGDPEFQIDRFKQE